MTTIAIKGTKIAVDSGLTNGNIRHPDGVQKWWIHQTVNIAAVGCGVFAEVQEFFRWLEKDCDGDRPPLKHANIYVVHGEGTVDEYSKHGKLSLRGRFFAEGASAEFVMGAMCAGADPAKAVRLATECTEGAFGDVWEIDVEARTARVV